MRWPGGWHVATPSSNRSKTRCKLGAPAAAAGLQQQVVRGVAAAVVRGLLLLAGDVESNPGPKKEQRHDDDEGEQMDAGGGGSSNNPAAQYTQEEEEEELEAEAKNAMYSSGRLLDSPDPNAAEHGRKLAESAIGVRLEPVAEEDPVPDSDMHVAAAEGDITALQGVYDAGHPGDTRAADGSTPLHRAAAAGQLGAVKWLSKHFGESMQNALDTEGRTPLAVAIYHERLMAARWLNDENRSTRHYKLHWAAQHGHLQAVQEVLTAGAPPDLPDEHRVTPLHRACKFGHPAIVQELLHTRKVDIDAVTDDGWTPVLLASAAGSAGIIRMLLEHARDKRLENTFMMQRLPKGPGVDAGLDVLLLGARYGHPEVVREALNNGANLATQDPKGNYPLHLAVVGGSPAHLDTMLLLLERGALWNEQNEKSYTPPLLARNHQEYCRNPSSCSHTKMSDAFSARHGRAAEQLEILLAARQGDTAKVQQFLRTDQERKFPPGSVTCANGWTALLVASKHGRTAVVEALLGAKVDIEATVAVSGGTPLMQAASYFHPDVAKLLLGAGAKVYRADKQGNTPLHRVCSKPAAKDFGLLARQVAVLQHLLGATAAYRSTPAEVDDPSAMLAAAGGHTLTTMTTTTVAADGKPGGGAAGAPQQGSAQKTGQLGATTTTTGGAAAGKAVLPAVIKKIKVFEVDMLNAQNAEGATPLMMAAVMGNMPLVEVLLNNTKVDVTIPDKNGAVALHKAARAGHLQMVTELIAAGSPVLPTDSQGNSPLHEAAAGGHVKVLRYLLTALDDNDAEIAKQVDVTNDQGWTPLHYAAENNHVEMLQLLMRFGADPKATIASGATALSLACKNGAVNVIEELAETFKEQENQMFRANTGGWNPISIAAYNKKHELAARMLDFMLTTIEESWDRQDVYHTVNQPTTTNGYTALHWAAERGNVEAVGILLQGTMSWATMLKSSGGRADVREYTKAPALHPAAYHGHTEICSLLFNAGAEITAVDEDGRQALSRAVYNNMQETAEMLLHWASYNTDGSAAPLLLGHQDRVRGFSPVHYAAMRGNIECVQLLERHEQDLEQLTRSGRTPLEIAAAFGHYELVDYLLSKDCTMDTVPRPLKSVKLKWRSDGPVRILKKEALINIKDGACATLACPLPASRGLSYFEVAIGEVRKDPSGKRPKDFFKVAVGIGVYRSTVPPHPGKAPGTFGYYGKTGMLSMGTGMENSKRYGPKFGPNDTIGVILNRSTRTISFTRNGTHMGVAVSPKEMGADLQLDSMSLLVMVEGIGELKYNLGGLDGSVKEPFLCSMDDVACDEEELHFRSTAEPWRFKERLHPIHLAANARSVPVLKRLLEAGAPCDQEDGDGWTPLHFAALAGWHEGIALLLEHHKQRVACANRTGHTADKADKTTAEEVMTHTAYVNKKTKAGSSPLRFAVMSGHLRASEALIKMGGADCLVIDSQHRTLLMLAASTGQIQLMDLLIKKGVAVKSKDNAGRTALQYASNAAAAEHLEKQTNETIPYDGFDWIELRVDSSTKQGAVGCVVMGKLCKTGEKIALKYHSKQENRDDTYKMLTSCFANGREARQSICCVPADLPEHQAKFDDPEKFPGHPYCLVLEGGDQTLQEILDELGPVEVPPGQAALQLPDGQVKFIFGCLVTALELVHNKGYAHHDLKAANFVRFYDGKFKLIDFDNARQAGRDPAGHTTPEICSPEYAKYYMATKLASRAKGGAPLKPPLSSQAMDMWSLGCVLYQLCTRRRLVADLAGWDTEEFQMRSADDAIKVWYDYKEEHLEGVLERYMQDNDAHQQAKELLQQLLKAKPEARVNIHQVANSVFLGKGVATLTSINANINTMNAKMDSLVMMVSDVKDRMVVLSDLPAQLQAGFKKLSGDIHSFRKMVLQTHKAVCPSTFVLGPELPLADVMDPEAASKQLTTWSDGLSALFSQKMSLSDIADQMTHESFKLKLVCESCGEPQGEGYSVKKPREWVPKMLPAMQVSLTVAKIANVGLSIASIVFPGVPVIPDGVLEAGDSIINALDHKSSAEDFACIQGTLDGESADGKTFQNQVDEGLRQLASFLATVDPTQTWGGLALVDLGATDATKAAAADAVVSQDVLWCCKGCLAGKCSAAGGISADAAKKGKDKGKDKGKEKVSKQVEQLQALHARWKAQDTEISGLRKYIKAKGLPLPPTTLGAALSSSGSLAASRHRSSNGGGVAGQLLAKTGSGKGGLSGSGKWKGLLSTGGATVHPEPAT